MDDCIFCRIAGREIPSSLVYEDDEVVAFNDLHPQAPVHVLVVPRKHIATLNDVKEADSRLVGHLLDAAAKVAREKGIAESGYRVTINVNRGAGQVVFHLHLHVMGGWKPD